MGQSQRCIPRPPRPPRAQLDRGMPVDFAGNWGRTALWYACSGNQPAAALLLLENRADPNVPETRNNMTPLDMAEMLRHKEISRKLLLKGAMSIPQGACMVCPPRKA